MPKCLTPSDLLGALMEMQRDPSASNETKAEIEAIFGSMEAIMSNGAELLNRELGVDCSAPDMTVDQSSDGMGFLAGTVSVYPQRPGDPVPDALINIDQEGDWEPREPPSITPQP